MAIKMAIARWMVVGSALLAGVAAAGEPPALEDEKAKRSYALGMAVGKQLRVQSVEVDPEVYVQGLKDAMTGGETRLTEAEGRAAIHRLHVERKQRKTSLQPAGPGAATAAGAIQVSFKLDPRVLKGLYMGDRWAPQVTYSSNAAPDVEAVTVAARARAAAAAGKASPSWIASDPEMVTISPAQGGEVKLTVRRAGESTVTVSVGELSSTLAVKAVRQADRWRVDLSGVQQPPLAGGVAAAAAAAAPVAEREER
jgi:hypothetical protein